VVVANLEVGETVLDLGSGGGLDVLLSAQRVGPTGKAYGLDMTDEMLHLARQNQADAGIDNVEFLRGSIEAIPLPDHSVDVVLSNCVIGLSPDKEVVFAEAYRVLRPWGRLAVADVVAEVEATPDQQADVESWVSCLGGALTRSQYQSALQAAGFAGVSIEESHLISEGFASVVVRAVKRRSGVSEQRERPSPDHRL
jgi:arsenite methyltransferase